MNNYLILRLIISLFLIQIIISCKGKKREPVTQNTEYKLELIANGFQSPVAMAAPNDQSNRIFICEQRGVLRLIKQGKLVEKPILDLRNKIVSLGSFYDERGLLGIALHPDFAVNGKLFVYYSSPSTIKSSNHKSRVSQFVMQKGKDEILPNSEKIILEIEQPEMNHNGGQLAFGPDGFLYIGLGDGGGSGDEHGATGNGQNLNTLLGKILRIDINTEEKYKIPEDNPFVNSGGKPEIYAWGLRNPWRFSFDKSNGKLYCADVGQNKYEELNLIKKAGNYGWKIMEGNHCFETKTCETKELILPVLEYNHDIGVSITGGYVYRGKILKDLVGTYIFADWTGPLFMTKEKNGTYVRENFAVANKLNEIRVLSFGEDEVGELYILSSQSVAPSSNKGALYKIVKK